MKTKNFIGIMQGRLLPPIDGRIQAFPGERWHEEFLIAKELGLNCIEFIFEGVYYKKHPLMEKDGIDEIQQTEAKTGIKVLSVCADYFMEFPLHKGNQNEKSVSVLQELITNSSMLNIKDIIIPCVDHSRLSGPEEIKKFKISLDKCIPLAERHNINLTLETDLSPKEFFNLLTYLDSPCIKVNYDIGNSASLGYQPEEEIEKYGKWITDVHIKDRVYNGSTVPIGHGNANLPVVFSKLKETDFSGIFILQTARKETGKEKETIKEYMDLIEKYLN